MSSSESGADLSTLTSELSIRVSRGQVAAELYRAAVDAVEGEGKAGMSADIFQAAIGNQVGLSVFHKGSVVVNLFT